MLSGEAESAEKLLSHYQTGSSLSFLVFVTFLKTLKAEGNSVYQHFGFFYLKKTDNVMTSGFLFCCCLVCTVTVADYISRAESQSRQMTTKDTKKSKDVVSI